MLTPIIIIYILATIFVISKITLEHKPKYKLVNEAGVPEELLKYIHSAVKLWSLKGTVTIIKYKRKREKQLLQMAI